jgi:phospholipid/cholesterol/gamma-HCH transport system ATP-binding protein
LECKNSFSCSLTVSTICCFQGYFAQLRADSHGAKAVGRTTTSGGVIRSLEGLQEELTGLYSRRQIKVLYHNQLKRRVLGEAYCVILLTLTNLDLLTAELGHKAVQMTIRSMGAFMDRQFGAIGGFCTRHSINEFVAMLPYSDAGECEGLLKNFAADLRQRGIYCLGNRSGNGSPSERSVEVALRSGIAQDQPTAELDAVI